MNVKVGELTGNSFNISTSRASPGTEEVFAAYIEHTPLSNGSFAPISYTVLPAITQRAFNNRLSSTSPSGVQELRNDAAISAIFDSETEKAHAVFWTEDAGSITFPGSYFPSVTLTVNAPVVVIFSTLGGDIPVSDPSQTLEQPVRLNIVGTGLGDAPPTVIEMVFELPMEGYGGDDEHSMRRTRRNMYLL